MWIASACLRVDLARCATRQIRVWTSSDGLRWRTLGDDSWHSSHNRRYPQFPLRSELLEQTLSRSTECWHVETWLAAWSSELWITNQRPACRDCERGDHSPSRPSFLSARSESKKPFESPKRTMSTLSTDPNKWHHSIHSTSITTIMIRDLQQHQEQVNLSNDLNWTTYTHPQTSSRILPSFSKSSHLFSTPSSDDAWPRDWKIVRTDFLTARGIAVEKSTNGWQWRAKPAESKA